MQSLIPADEFVTECQPRHKSSFLQPENGTETAAEKNTFHCSESNQTFGKTAILYPAQSPLCFFLNRRNGFNCMEQAVFFLRIFYITVNEQGVSFGVYIFH